MVGELCFYGPNIFHCYWRAPEATARAFDENGYYKSGDLFEIAGDAKQYYRYIGRSKDLAIRGGMNISSEEIEGLLAGIKGVREVAVAAGRAVLSDALVQRLARAGAGIKQRFGGKEQDIEWAVQGDQVIILQSRPFISAPGR